MELNKLLEEIRIAERDIGKIESVISHKVDGKKLCVSVSDERYGEAPADNEFLIDALNSKKIELTERLNKLNEAKQMSEKIISGLIA
ncbi:hypothetical protein ABLB90_10645 [Photorhabdus bodei]|uniref:hypothetical protein n=1 Tax=Photorhabdus bodei TaxID=2029681 RepID=UPI0032B73A8F